MGAIKMLISHLLINVFFTTLECTDSPAIDLVLLGWIKPHKLCHVQQAIPNMIT